jgi:hypothetical protein
MVPMLALLMLIPATAMAQRRVPAAESGAVGGEVGLFFPADDSLSTGPVLEGFYEYYFTARTSMRVGLGWAEPESDVDDEDSLRIIRVPFDMVYNWERGAVHPFVGAGIGAYFLQLKDNGQSFGDSATKLGATLFGGAEFFTGPTTALKAEARYHIVDDVLGVEGDGLALTIGFKKYF